MQAGDFRLLFDFACAKVAKEMLDCMSCCMLTAADTEIIIQNSSQKLLQGGILMVSNAAQLSLSFSLESCWVTPAADRNLHEQIFCEMLFCKLFSTSGSVMDTRPQWLIRL